jgi:hypothetical protein
MESEAPKCTFKQSFVASMANKEIVITLIICIVFSAKGRLVSKVDIEVKFFSDFMLF